MKQVDYKKYEKCADLQALGDISLSLKGMCLNDIDSIQYRLLVPGGVYSFFNGLCPDNIFFNMVQSEVVKLELARYMNLLPGMTWVQVLY